MLFTIQFIGGMSMVCSFLRHLPLSIPYVQRAC